MGSLKCYNERGATRFATAAEIQSLLDLPVEDILERVGKEGQ